MYSILSRNLLQRLPLSPHVVLRFCKRVSDFPNAGDYFVNTAARKSRHWTLKHLVLFVCLSVARCPTRGRVRGPISSTVHECNRFAAAMYDH